MRNLATLATAVVLAAGCQGSSTTAPETTASATPTAFNTGGAPTVSFSVPDMMCEYSCVEQVKEALAAQPGVKEVKIDFAAKQATVAVDAEKFDSEAAIATLVDYQFTNSQLVEPGAGEVVTANAQVISEDDSK